MTNSAFILMLIAFTAFYACVHSVSDQQHILNLVNQYRNEHGLPSIPTSYWLTATAQMKDIDRRDNGLPESYGCTSGHSWSGRSPLFSGPCCYSSANWQCMCLKPTEISNGRFNGIAYENWVRAPNAEVAVNAWKNSPSHNALMLNLDGWAGSTWKSMGAFHCAYYYSLWFSETEDPDAGADIDILTCNTDTNTPVPLPFAPKPTTKPSSSSAPSSTSAPSKSAAAVLPTPNPVVKVGEPKLWMGGHTARDSSWSTIAFNQRFDNPVVLCSLFNTKDKPSMVVRVRNVNSNNFELQVLGINRHVNFAVDVDCIAVEEGVYTMANNGVKFEARII